MSQCHSQDSLHPPTHSGDVLSVYDFSYELLPACSEPQPVVKHLPKPPQTGRYVVLVNLHESSRTRYYLAKKLHEMHGDKSFQDYRQEIENSPASSYVVLKTDDWNQANALEQFFLENHCQVQLVEQTKVAGFSVF